MEKGKVEEGPKGMNGREIEQHFNEKGKLVFDGFLVGLVSGLFSVFYRFVLGEIDELRPEFFDISGPLKLAGVVTLVFIGGLVLGKILKWEPYVGGSGIPQTKAEILGLIDSKPLRVTFGKIFGGSLGSLLGLSIGREGPSIQIGASMGKWLSKVLKRDRTQEKYLISAGASAGLAAAFSAPLAGTMFTMEEMHHNFSSRLMIPSVIAAVTADFLSKYIFGLSPVFSLEVKAPLPLRYYWLLPVIALATSMVGFVFSKGILYSQDLYGKFLPKGYRPLLAVFIALPVAIFAPALTGGGHHLLEETAKGETILPILAVLLVAKLLFTLASFSSGTVGGIFLPLLVLGGLTGSLIYQLAQGLMGTDFLINCIIVAMAGILTAVVRSPILAIVLVTEMTGSFGHLLSLTITTILAYLISEYIHLEPIYESLLARLIKGKEPKEQIGRIIKTFTLGIGSDFAHRPIKDLDLPENALIINVQRQGWDQTPKGHLILKPGDEVTILLEEKYQEKLQHFFSN